MKRNPVRSGLRDQRSRATSRRRERRPTTEPAADDLADWIDGSWIRDSDVRSIDLNRFVSDTHRFADLPGERLRQLAIRIESRACALRGLEGWHALSRIYNRAVELGADQTQVLVSMTYAASTVAACADRDESSKRILNDGRNAALEAIEESPTSAAAHASLGHIDYLSGDPVRALASFDAALASQPDPATSAWVQLYRAHSLHDLARWDEALIAYRLVDRSAFVGVICWRVDVMREQEAECLYQTGQIDEAKRVLTEILARYEKDAHAAFWAMSASFWRLVDCLGYGPRARQIDEAATAVVLRQSD